MLTIIQNFHHSYNEKIDHNDRANGIKNKTKCTIGERNNAKNKLLLNDFKIHYTDKAKIINQNKKQCKKNY